MLAFSFGFDAGSLDARRDQIIRLLASHALKQSGDSPAVVKTLTRSTEAAGFRKFILKHGRRK